LLTTQAQEKIYRSDGAPARIELDITLHSKAQFEWLPQETILFHAARLHRELRARMAADASLLLLESQIFGRLASGETDTCGSLRETWRIVRADKLIFAEELRLEGNIAEKLDRKALGNGARAIGTLLFVAPDAEASLDKLCAQLHASPAKGLHCAASAWNGMLLSRFAAVSPELLRGAMIAALSALRGRALPRVWQV
jgi:urease accessory protein